MQAYFDLQATHIQRWFRGFWSRKYIHNFGQRKAYLAAIADKNRQMRLLAEHEQEVSIRYRCGLGNHPIETVRKVKLCHLQRYQRARRTGCHGQVAEAVWQNAPPDLYVYDSRHLQDLTSDCHKHCANAQWETIGGPYT